MVYKSSAMNTLPASFFSRLPALFLFLLCPLFLWGCKYPSIMPGEIASVNGQSISYREVEIRRINQFAGRSPEARTWNETTLQAQYRYVLNQIIEELVICQYMESKKLVLEPGVLDAEEKLIRDDYPENTFDQMLAEEGVNLEEWREGLRRRLVIRQFLTQVLRQEITITSDEVQRYFTEHSADFIIPEQWHFMQITGPDKKTVENARGSFIATRNATAVQKEFLVSIHDIRVGKDRLPEDLTKELAPLALWKGSPVKAVDEEFRTVVLTDKTPASMLEAAEMAKRVEQALAEEKMRELYAAWVSKRVANADIRIAPALLVERKETEEPAPGSPGPHNATFSGNGTGRTLVPAPTGVPTPGTLPGGPLEN